MKIHHVDIMGASLTLLLTVYSFLLALLLMDAIIHETIRKLVRLFSF
jgi:hypothetical protein